MSKNKLSILYIAIIFLITYIFSIFLVKIYLRQLIEYNINEFIYYSNFTFLFNYIISGILSFWLLPKGKKVIYSIYLILILSIISTIINFIINNTIYFNILEILYSVLFSLVFSISGYLIGYILSFTVSYLKAIFKS